jgi:hypothetical protein
MEDAQEPRRMPQAQNSFVFLPLGAEELVAW